MLINVLKKTLFGKSSFITFEVGFQLMRNNYAKIPKYIEISDIYFNKGRYNSKT